MKKEQRNLSGIYFRVKRDGKFENITFEDLSEEEQKNVMSGKSKEWLESLAQKLADTLNSTGDTFNLYV